MQTVMYRMEKQDPTVSTENYVQHPVTSHDGKEYEKEYIYIYFFAIQQKLTQHCKSTTVQ